MSKGDFSRSPLTMLLASQAKGYVGLHIEQGVPILDRDLNLLQDLLSAGMRSLFTRIVGNGVPPESDSFAIQAMSGTEADFLIAAGDAPCIVEGIVASISEPVAYSKQPDAERLTAPTPEQADPRIDTVYLDVFLVEEDGSQDLDLANTEDVGMRTSVRIKPTWVVRVAEGQKMPKPDGGHSFYMLAELRRQRLNQFIEPTMITDKRRRLLSIANLEERLRKLEQVLMLPAFASPPFKPPSGLIKATISLFGTNFTVGGAGGVTVLFGDRPATVSSHQATQLQVVVPEDVVPTGTNFRDVKITVVTAGGMVVSDDTFRAARASLPPTFAVPPFSPPSGTAGDTIELKGDNFNWPPTTVKFGNTTAELVGSPTHTQIKVKVPEGLAAPGLVRDVSITVITTVTTGAGSSSLQVISPSLFRVLG